MCLGRSPYSAALVLLLMACVAVASLQAAPQAGSNPETSFRGHVVDESGAAVKGARIAVAHEGLAAETILASDERGDFALTLGPGTWIVDWGTPPRKLAFHGGNAVELAPGVWVIGPVVR